MFRPSPVYSNAPGLGRDRGRSPTASATGLGPYGVPALLCNRVGSLLAREVFSASPNRLGERAAPKLTNDARDESPDLLARYPEALRACLTYDLRGPGPLGRSPSLAVGAPALTASSACRCNSAGSPPCSSMMLSSSSSPYSVTMICPSFRLPGGRFSAHARLGNKRAACATGGRSLREYGKSPLQERLRRLYAGLLTLSRGSGPLLFSWLEKVNSLTAKLREVATLCESMVISV